MWHLRFDHLQHLRRMGICHSSFNAVDEMEAPAPPTVKLVLQDGELQEFAQPVRASHVLQSLHSTAYFVCDADDMVFDGHAPAADELRPGQLYFVLPVSMLRRPLHAEEMAALAVKANAALVGKVPPAAVFEKTLISINGNVAGTAKGRRSGIFVPIWDRFLYKPASNGYIQKSNYFVAKN